MKNGAQNIAPPKLLDAKKLMDKISGHGDFIRISWLFEWINNGDFSPEFLMCKDCGQQRILPDEKDRHDMECKKDH